MAAGTAAGKRDRTHWLYLAVIAAVVLGIVVGFVFPDFAVSLKWLGTGFVALIKMLIAPVIFCTIVLGIGAIRQAAKVGRIGGLALGYFLLMSTVALAIGLVVGNILHPGDGLQLSDELRGAGADLAGTAEESGGTTDFVLGLIPTTLVSALTEGSVLQALLVALLTGFAIQALGREFLLIVSTSSSETALPRLIAKMEHAGVSKPVAGIVVPTGYSFNLDGTAIYLTMASLFIAEALGDPLSIGEQLGLLVFMIIASKGAAGVTGAGLATLAGGLSAHRPELLDGVGLIVGIDRFMSEARAVTNFAGNAIATVLIATWTRELDREQLSAALSGRAPFDEATMLDEHGDGPDELPEQATNAGPGQRDAGDALRKAATPVR